MRKRIYTHRTVHSSDYYLTLLLALIAGLNAKLTHQGISNALNSHGIKTPQGLSFSALVVKDVLKKIRLHADYPNAVYVAMLGLIVAGRLTVEQCRPLVEMRSGVM
jgi:hypothetical protein